MIFGFMCAFSSDQLKKIILDLGDQWKIKKQKDWSMGTILLFNRRNELWCSKAQQGEFTEQ